MNERRLDEYVDREGKGALKLFISLASQSLTATPHWEMLQIYSVLCHVILQANVRRTTV